ncbi:MAG: amidohydrolase family protein [Armatimonas sp.]
MSIIDVHCGWGPTTAAPYWNDAAEVTKGLRARGITQAFVSSSLARRYDPVAGNDSVAETVANQAAGTCDLKGWLVCSVAQLDEASSQLRRYLYTDNFVGMAVYPDPLVGHPVTYTDFNELFTLFRRYGKPLLIETPTAEAMAEAVNIAAQLQGIKVITSGMGGREWQLAIELAAKPVNLFLDISGALAPEKLPFAIKTIGGVRKLLFASGAPQTDPMAILALVDELDIHPEDKARILGGNARRIFGLGGETDDEGTGGVSLTPMGR